MITPFSKFRTKEDVIDYLDDDSKLIYPIVDNIASISKHIIDPYDEDCYIFDKNSATIAGLYIKQSQLYSEYIDAYKFDKLYLCLLFQRIIYESFIKMCYLISNGTDAQNEYRLSSYKDRYKFYKAHRDKDGYFKVRNDKFLLDLEEDGFEISDLDIRLRSFGGKNMRQLITEYDKEELYTSLYGISSDSIHSDWGEIRQVYLSKLENANYAPIINSSKHFRMLIPMCSLMIDSSIVFTKWIKNTTFHTILAEHSRIINLIGESIFDEYNKLCSKFMQE